MPKNKKRIPDPTPVPSNRLHSELALIRGEEDGSAHNFRLSFDYYKENMCEIEDLDMSSARKCLTKFKHLGKSNHKNIFEKNIRHKSVIRTGRYKELFSSLSADVSLFEIDLGSASRLFYFTVRNIVHVVAIKNSHVKY